MAKVAYLGLGVMGYPMAGHLARSGHEVVVFNRTKEKAERWVKEHGGSLGATPAEAASGAEFVFSCVGADDDLRSVALGDNGAFSAMEKGSIYVDNTTASAEVARELYGKASELGLGFIDAPVSGGQSGAEQGILTVMCGGDADIFARAEPIIASFGKTVKRVGDCGSGQLTKMVNQLCIAGLVQGLSEGLNFGSKVGLDMELVLEVIGGGAAQSWQMDNRGSTMLKGEFDFGFAVDLMIKDLGLCLAEAERHGVAVPISEEVLGFYKELSASGDGRADTSCLIKRLR